MVLTTAFPPKGLRWGKRYYIYFHLHQYYYHQYHHHRSHQYHHHYHCYYLSYYHYHDYNYHHNKYCYYCCNNDKDDSHYWIYSLFDHLHQIYYKMRRVLLQSATACFLRKCDGLLLQSATAFSHKTTVDFLIIKCHKCCYKLRQFYNKVSQVLQSVTVIKNYY